MIFSIFVKRSPKENKYSEIQEKIPFLKKLYYFKLIENAEMTIIGKEKLSQLNLIAIQGEASII